MHHHQQYKRGQGSSNWYVRLLPHPLSCHLTISADINTSDGYFSGAPPEYSSVWAKYITECRNIQMATGGQIVLLNLDQKSSEIRFIITCTSTLAQSSQTYMSHSMFNQILGFGYYAYLKKKNLNILYLNAQTFIQYEMLPNTSRFKLYGWIQTMMLLNTQKTIKI